VTGGLAGSGGGEVCTVLSVKGGQECPWTFQMDLTRGRPQGEAGGAGTYGALAGYHRGRCR
jgi:hypothetical protein